MPPIAFGTFGKIKDVKTITKTVVEAIESGYRHFDTAPLYFNEVQVGEGIVSAIERGLVDRKDLFITTKLDIYSNRSEVVPALKRSLQRLQLAYVDLYLIHIPFDVITGKEINCTDIWEGMEEAKLSGLTNSIGISNFNHSQIDKILEVCNIKPAVIQVEVSPTFTNIALVDYCQSHQIHVTAFSPFGFLAPRPFRNYTPTTDFANTTLVTIAKKHNKTPSQIVLRYLIDRGITPIPASSNKDYMQLNFNVFDFSLTQSEVVSINNLNVSEAVYDFDNLDNLYQYFFDTNMEEVFKIVNDM
ncbi:aldo-keto reductase AKR2E4-like [Danaus plexippus]|uniref:aldo-keto reductase AKR2E4-like n=1 Tax=Danaus plexippus TaxID=13037 RepID=UPI002AAF97B3|nr:aldo-keto reductase AKR2E4-like [Danaus plexippus]